MKGGAVRIAFVAVALLVAANAAGADRPCNKGEAAAASKALDRTNTWGELHKSWKDWHQCDSGPTADIFTDAFLRLAIDWKNVGALAGAMRGDPGFHDFVLARVKTGAKDDRDALYSRAKSSCPKGEDAFCGDIAAAAMGKAAPKAGAAQSIDLDLSPIKRLPDAPAKK